MVVLDEDEVEGGFSPVVNMLAVGTTVGKPLLAFWTLEGLLAAVETPVLGQVVFVFESLLAIRAFVWT